MTQRKIYNATLTVNGETFEAQAFAFNSAIRASEGLMRTYARTVGQMFQGGQTSREGNVYTRQWLSSDGLVSAVATVSPAEV
jgi:predicted GH43/DUF377 family glycosyl hydrolase